MNLSNLRKNHDDRTSNKPKNEIKTNKVDHAEDIGAFSGGYSSAGRAAVINQRPSDTLRCLNSALLLIRALASHTTACISLSQRTLMLIPASSLSHVLTIKQAIETLHDQQGNVRPLHWMTPDNQDLTPAKRFLYYLPSTFDIPAPHPRGTPRFTRWDPY
jgi:hypothetical protein